MSTPQGKDGAEEVSMLGGLVNMERCSNQDESVWQMKDDKVQYVPSRCRGFFGRIFGLYFDTLPQLAEPGWKQEQEDKEFGYGGIHEGAQRWEEQPPPPSAPTHAPPPATMQFVSSSGKTFTKHFDYGSTSKAPPTS